MLIYFYNIIYLIKKNPTKICVELTKSSVKGQSLLDYKDK